MSRLETLYRNRISTQPAKIVRFLTDIFCFKSTLSR